MKTALIQLKANSILDYKEAYENVLRMTEQAAKAGARLAVLPECAYPAYFLGLDMEKAKEAIALSGGLTEKLKSLAARYKMYIATGIVIEQEGKWYNAAIMIDDNGKIIQSAAKSNLWHFDSKWFTASECYEVFTTRFGVMGIIICADGRLPEIARILSLAGARIIIDPVNLVAAAEEPKLLTNQQYQFILPVRAAENGVWMLVADKAGLEAGCVNYLGRSMVIDPNGKIAACASPDEQEIIYYDMDLSLEPEFKPIKRKPELYGILAKENNALPIVADMGKPKVIQDCEVFSSTIMYHAPTREEYISKAKYYLFCCTTFGSKLQFLPQSTYDIDSLTRELAEAIPSGIFGVISGRENGIKCAALLSKGETLGKWYKTHGAINGESLSDMQFHCADTPLGKIGVMFDEEAYVPEIARAYMLLGCNILLWADCRARELDTKVMQTRAAENKIFVMRNSSAEKDCGAVSDTEGRILTSTCRGVEQAAHAMIVYSLSLSKTVVPGTNIVTGRKNRSYRSLTE